MISRWATFEDRVRGTAALIHNRPCEPGRIGGVDLDGVIEIDQGHFILIEITVQTELRKVRDDITKLRTARAALMAEKEALAECYCILDGTVTKAMTEAASPHRIKVFDANAFSRLFFDFTNYKLAREKARFGSAVNPHNGVSDKASYVSVKYVSQDRSKEHSAIDIANLLRSGKRVILLGDYGAGKSRCLREIFFQLGSTGTEDTLYPIAIDLRDAWGLKRGPELVRRHFDDLGLERLQPSALSALASGSVALLIDGFDEIGTQSWSNDGQQLKAIRAQALQGVKDLISRSSAGVLVTGRDHYFSSSDEMFSCLGFDQKASVVLKCKEEFTSKELDEFFRSRGITAVLPSWVPKRPLICQTVGDLDAEQLDRMFGVEGGEIEFWDHLIDTICKRDAIIHPTFNADTIKKVLVHLAMDTRVKSANVGPISLMDSQQAFTNVVGQMPIEEASAMLQRLPCLGRLSAESNDRQFVDEYILDGLRAVGVVELSKADNPTKKSIIDTVWINPLDQLGLHILARYCEDHFGDMISLATKANSGQNRVLASDIIAALLLSDMPFTDFKSVALDQGKFLLCDLRRSSVSNLQISNTYFAELHLPPSAPPNTILANCVAERVYGAASAAGLPAWIKNLEAEHYDSVENVSKVRKLDLSREHQVLVTIIKKTFFQKGSGRKEDALLRGLGQFVSPRVLQTILSILMREKCLTRFKGDDGFVYSPVRDQAGRMQKMLYNLRSSDDQIWQDIGNLKA